MMVDQSNDYAGPAGIITQVDRNGSIVRHQDTSSLNGLGISAQVDRNGNAVKHQDLMNGSASKAMNYDSPQFAVPLQTAPASGLLQT